MSKIDSTKLKECPAHGFYLGDRCHRCTDNASLTPVVVEAPPPPVEEEVDKSKWWNGLERDLHKLFEQECDRREVSYIHAYTHTKSTIAAGHPDFTCFRQSGERTLACLIEFKTRTGRLRKDQEECIAELKRKGIDVLITGDFFEAVTYLKSKLEL